MNYLKATLYFSLTAFFVSLMMMMAEPAPTPTNAEQCVDPEYSISGNAKRTAITLIKNWLNDPSSFEKVEQHFAGTRVVTNYRAKNQYGGVIPGVSIAEVTFTEGKCIITVIQYHGAEG